MSEPARSRAELVRSTNVPLIFFCKVEDLDEEELVKLRGRLVTQMFHVMMVVMLGKE